MTLDRSATGTQPQLTTSIETLPCGTARVRVRGELDIATAGTFHELLVAALGRDRPGLVIDASQLSFCDSQGLAALAGAADLAEAHGGRITIENLQAPVARVLRVTGLDGRFAGS